MNEYLEFGESLATKRVNDEMTLFLDLYYADRRKVYVITLQNNDSTTEIAQTNTETHARQLFMTAYSTLRTEEKSKGEQSYYDR